MPARRRAPHGLVGLAALALGLLSWASTPTPTTAAEIDTPKPSGLAWRSGASINPYDGRGDAFAAWRGRPLDVRVAFIEHDTWDKLKSRLRGPEFRGECRETPLCVVSLAMFPESAHGQFRQCAGGAFDAKHRELAGLIADARRGAVVRIGWEANSKASHPWRIATASDVAPYKACFRRLARIHKAAGLLVEWANSKRQAFPLLETYPGDDAVDVWGMHQYDNDTRGIAFADYVAEARRRGKKVGVGEWGVKLNGDNPDYVRRMFGQFRTHAADLAYESYFNRGSVQMLYPKTVFPKSARTYRELWGR